MARVNKKQSVEIDRSASGGGQEKSMKWVSFSCPLLEHTNFYGVKQSFSYWPEYFKLYKTFNRYKKHTTYKYSYL
jgi:hypothetical protein